MGQTKFYKQFRLMRELGPLCDKDENRFACGYEGESWKAWIRLVPGELVLSFHADWPKVGFYDMSHKQLDDFRALEWKVPKPLSTLEFMARESADLTEAADCSFKAGGADHGQEEDDAAGGLLADRDP